MDTFAKPFVRKGRKATGLILQVAELHNLKRRHILIYQLFKTSLAVIGFGFATSSFAGPMLDFDIDGPGSSVDSSGIELCSGCSTVFNLASGLDDEVFSLEAGESYTFDFFTADLFGPSSGFGGIGGVVDATLAFSSPDDVDATGTGLGGGAWAYVLFVGWGGAGGLTFDLAGQPDDILLGNGSSFGVEFSTVGDLCGGRGCDLSQTIQATITAKNVVAPVPEPSSLALLGLGLAGLGLSRRKAKV